MPIAAYELPQYAAQSNPEEAVQAKHRCQGLEVPRATFENCTSTTRAHKSLHVTNTPTPADREHHYIRSARSGQRINQISRRAHEIQAINLSAIRAYHERYLGTEKNHRRAFISRGIGGFKQLPSMPWTIIRPSNYRIVRRWHERVEAVSQIVYGALDRSREDVR